MTSPESGAPDPKPPDSDLEGTPPPAPAREPDGAAGPDFDPAVPLPLDDPSEVERGSFLERLRLSRIDIGLLVAFVLVAFFFRFFSPILPNFLTGQPGPPITNCVHSTPIDQSGRLGTLCGLAYPYQKSSAPKGKPASPPNGEVFDEIYFGVFAHDDLEGFTYFDPEPPIAKYVIAGGEWLYGFYRHDLRGEPGTPASLGFNTFGWRLGVCVVGSLAIGLLYFLALQLWRNRWFAIAAAFFACFDGMFLVESRIGVIDVVPATFQILALALFLVHLRARTPRDSIFTLGLTGVALGLGFASKWTALAALGIVAFFLVARPLASRIGRIQIGQWGWEVPDRPLPGGASGRLYWPSFCVLIFALPLAIYVASWIPWFFFTSGPYTFK
ncbi:MAG: phospholipid carrier-dependent glycosyltransferase, partial [Candidatus Dormibacteraceae bacterium]